jgi:hypothetical protein
VESLEFTWIQLSLRNGREGSELAPHFHRFVVSSGESVTLTMRMPT